MLRVVEVGRGYACRFGGWVLATQGAEVRRLRMPDDASWAWLPGPPPASIDPVDLAATLADADVCLIDDLGLARDAFRAQTPRPPGLERLVVVELQGSADRPDANGRIGAATGVNAAIGPADGPGRPPPGRMLEALAGVHAAVAALAGVLGARRDGLGEHVVVNPEACIAGMVGVNAIQFFNYGLRWFRAGRTAYGSGGPYPFRLFRAKDGWVVAMCRSRAEWESLLSLLGDPPWSQQPKFADPLAIAREHSGEVTALIEAAMADRPVGQLWDDARRHRVPLAPVRNRRDVLDDRRLMDNDAVPHPATDVQSGEHPVPSHWLERRPPTDGPAVQGPLAGLRVLDFGWVWAGPIASAWLADLGADVVKVESLTSLDGARRRGIEFPSADSDETALPPYERTLLFSACNRNKRSVNLDVKDPEDHARLLDLVASADVMLENFSSSALERMGLDPSRLFAVNPSLLLVSLGGRTADGAFLSRSYAPMLSALVGLDMALLDEHDEPLGMPNWGVGDPNAGSWAVAAVLGALARGEGGRHLLVSQLRALVNTCMALYREPGEPPWEAGDEHELTRADLDGTGDGPLGELMRRVVVRPWHPRAGERVAFGPPWQFRRMPVMVRGAAPLLGSTDADHLLREWNGTGPEHRSPSTAHAIDRS